MLDQQPLENIFLILAFSAFILMTLGGFVFFIILRYHFKKFNYEEDPRGNWLVKNYITIYIALVLLGVITILINLFI